MSLTDAISNTERSLSKYAAYPFIGTIPAALKILMGVIELVAAAIFVVLATPFACCSELARDSLEENLGHVKNGFKNIIVGSLEAVPFLGTLLYVCGCFFRITRAVAMGAIVGASEGLKQTDNLSVAPIAVTTGAALGAVFGGVAALSNE